MGGAARRSVVLLRLDAGDDVHEFFGDLVLSQMAQRADRVTERGGRVVIAELSFVNQRHIWGGVKPVLGL